MAEVAVVIEVDENEEEPTLATEDTKPLSYKVKLGYGSGEAGLYGLSSLWGFFLSSFLLEGAYLKPSYVVIVTVVGQLADAFTDPLVGLLSDEFSLDGILAFLDKEDHDNKCKWKQWLRSVLVWLHAGRVSFLWTGRRKPFIAGAVVPFCVTIFLLFIVPPLPAELSYEARQFVLFLYYFVVFTIVNVTYGIVGVAYNSLTPDITESYNERTTLTMYRMMLGMVASLFSVASQAALLTALKEETADGHDDYRLPYGLNVAAWAIIGFLCIVATLATVEEKAKGKRVANEGEHREVTAEVALSNVEEKDNSGIRQRHSEKNDEELGVSASVSGVLQREDSAASQVDAGDHIADDEEEVIASSGETASHSDSPTFSLASAMKELLANLKDTLSNKAFLLIVTCYTCAWVGLNFIQGNLLLYVKYVLQEEEFFFLFTLLLQGFAILSLKPWAMVSARIGKKRTFYIGGTMFLISGAGFLFLPSGGGSIIVMLAGSTVSGSCVGCMLLMPWAMLPDVVQLDELDSGKKREGSFYAFFVFFQKVGLGLSLGFSTLVLDLAGYDNRFDIQEAVDVDDVVDLPLRHEQAPSVILALRIMVGLFPMVLMAIALLAVYLFPITRSSHALVTAELARRRANTNDQLSVETNTH